MESSNVCTVAPSIPALVWGWRSASGLLNGQAAGSGWSLNSDEAQPSASQFPAKSPSDPERVPEPECIILLVEDSTADAKLIREALREHSVNCELIHVSDGERALALIDEFDSADYPCPDLVILDLNLPRRPGRDVLERVRSSGRCGHVPVVVLTSSNDQRDRDDAERLGASMYIRKPSRLSDLLKLGEVFKAFVSKPPDAVS